MIEGGPLAPRRRCLVRLSAALASGDRGRLEEAVGRALEALVGGEVEQREVEEAILQSYLFVGFPAMLEAMELWREGAPEPPDGSDPLAGPGREEMRRKRGEAVCERVYGRAYEPLRRKLRELHPALDRWAVTEGYGKVLGRDGLPLVDRELCNVALLAVRGREPQLHSHLRGALEAGASAGTVDAALALALEAVGGDERKEAARKVWRGLLRGGDPGAGSGGAADAADGDGPEAGSRGGEPDLELLE